MSNSHPEIRSNSDPETNRRPRFGELARELFGVGPEFVEECLEQQRRYGGRLGGILVGRGLLTGAQVVEILEIQAVAVAESMRLDRPSAHFPYAGFFSLCLPAYDERENIEDTLDTACAILPSFVERFEVVVVDDGSRDGTREVVERFAARDSRVRLVRHARNRGYGAAVASGLRAARGELVAFIDSDGQFSLLDLPRLLTSLDGHDVVVGYRRRRADPLIRSLNAWAWNVLVHVALGVRVKDLDCAFKLFRREAVDRLRPMVKGQAFSADLLAQCVLNQMRIAETPVEHYPRYHGSPTGARPLVILRAFVELAQLFWIHRVVPLWKSRVVLPALRSLPLAKGELEGVAKHTPWGSKTAPSIPRFQAGKGLKTRVEAS